MTNSAHTFHVLLVEDMGMFRAFMEKWLATLPRFQLVGSAGSGEEAIRLMETITPDVLVVDLQLPGIDGLEFVSIARQLRPQVRALVLTSLLDPLTLTRVRESGVEGYVEKDAPPEVLAVALETVATGRQFYSARFSETLALEGQKSTAVGKILSRREQEVLSHVLLGKTSREISEVIGLSARTVEFHRANIMTKLGATNVTELVANAKQRGLSA
ncbi:LuxR C-terminal-related transcriptional regulator [Oleiharenicola lentus]|uniref:LuxR C-terminal-related transcriptional regulator n=1 Tax=Oleiharenicola lentus TaxID=2508720 RepID=UPI003F67030C